MCSVYRRAPSIMNVFCVSQGSEYYERVLCIAGLRVLQTCSVYRRAPSIMTTSSRSCSQCTTSAWRTSSTPTSRPVRASAAASNWHCSALSASTSTSATSPGTESSPMTLPTMAKHAGKSTPGMRIVDHFRMVILWN